MNTGGGGPGDMVRLEVQLAEPYEGRKDVVRQPDVDMPDLMVDADKGRKGDLLSGSLWAQSKENGSMNCCGKEVEVEGSYVVRHLYVAYRDLALNMVLYGSLTAGWNTVNLMTCLMVASCPCIRRAKGSCAPCLWEAQSDVVDRNDHGCLARDTYRCNDESATLVCWKEVVALGSDRMANDLTSPSNWTVEDSAKEVSCSIHGFADAHYETSQCPEVAMSVSVEMNIPRPRTTRYLRAK